MLTNNNTYSNLMITNQYQIDTPMLGIDISETRTLKTKNAFSRSENIVIHWLKYQVEFLVLDLSLYVNAKLYMKEV